MLKQYSIINLIKAIQKRVEDSTGMKCYDHVDLNTPSPFYYAEFVRSTPANTKTMFRTNYEIYIHVIAEPNSSSVPMLKYIEMLEEAMTEDIKIDDPYFLNEQRYNGVLSQQTDDTNEKHAITDFNFIVTYGYMMK